MRAVLNIIVDHFWGRIHWCIFVILDTLRCPSMITVGWVLSFRVRHGVYRAWSEQLSGFFLKVHWLKLILLLAHLVLYPLVFNTDIGLTQLRFVVRCSVVFGRCFICCDKHMAWFRITLHWDCRLAIALYRCPWTWPWPRVERAYLSLFGY